MGHNNYYNKYYYTANFQLVKRLAKYNYIRSEFKIGGEISEL